VEFAEGLHFEGRQNIQALMDVNLEIAESEFLSIVGPSGCGKTTLLKILSGVLQSSAVKFTSRDKD